MKSKTTKQDERICLAGYEIIQIFSKFGLSHGEAITACAYALQPVGDSATEKFSLVFPFLSKTREKLGLDRFFRDQSDEISSSE